MNHPLNLNLLSVLISVNYLNTTIFKDPKNNNTLLTKVFFKPTDIHQMLDKHPFHPKHTYKGLLRSQIIRFLEYVLTRGTFITHGVFLFNPSAKELTLKDVCVVLKEKLVGNCK